MRTIKKSLIHAILYYTAKYVVYIYFKIGWRLAIIGDENIPKEGGVILAANHRSYADPPIVGVSTVREVHFLAKQELFRFKPFGWLIGILNAHPLDRAGDVGALRAAKKLLDDGYAMILFPEGRRNRTNVLAKPKAGVGLLARMAGCPIIPTYIHNSAEMFFFKKISIFFGTPISPKKFDSNQSFADEVVRRINELKQSQH